MIDVNEEECTGCEECVRTCPEGAIKLVEEVANVDEDKCTACGACVSACPLDAIEIEIQAQTAGDLSEYEDVWVFMEQEGLFEECESGGLKPVGPQLLNVAKNLAEDIEGNVCAVIVGNDIEDLYDKCASYGAEKIYAVKDESLETYSTEAFTSALSVLISKHKPEVLLFGATHVGRNLAPSIAGNLGLGLTADCTGLSIEKKNGEKLLVQTRPAFGGNVMADIVCPNTRPQMATVRPGVFKPPEQMEAQEYEVVKEEMEAKPDIPTEILEILAGEAVEENIEEADCIISGGRGVGAPENFEVLEELAEEIGGVVGCSRPVVEKDWMPKARQVGQSGKTVSPKLYIAAGISGAIQHKVGIRGSDTIIAINTDPEAPIFEIADFSIVGDLHEVVPLLTQKIRGYK